MAVGLEHCLVVSISLFLLGVFIVMTQRNGIRVLMGIELILNAANLNLIAFNRFLPNTDVNGSIFAVFVIILAAAEAAVALAIVLAIYQQFSTVNLDEISSMKH
ncbi:MAG: NADH-quinone oxidoreductase subunit NuoK [Candidatus Omnitrophota bacterium]|jgi:NADH-quinone oxidoreductase subunit K|nr:MAG: NADH-quinone oxidoreductase subunit NuoK [Candidatus Omnitrophota bacterium]